MQRRSVIKKLAAIAPVVLAGRSLGKGIFPTMTPDAGAGPFKPNWESLSNYRVPDWFRDAKFGIWAHWGPQCQPEYGDWYARGMYQEGSSQYKYHLQRYGHPSVFGFKDVIHDWKAERWDPESLVAFYKQAGARYFVGMASHHDNLDMFNSRHQPQWNSVKVGPGKDIVAGWARAARNNGLPFGVSVHASHAWLWYETSQRSDKSGPYAGVPYDGKLRKGDGKGKWWEGLDPQDLYAQEHPLSVNSLDNGALNNQWNWGNGAAPPSRQYLEKFYNRVIDLVDQHRPELLYFDDTKLPFWPIGDQGLRIAAHFYNRKGSLAVLNGKGLDEQQRKAMVWDIERGQSNSIEPLPWQTDTCIGGWHYDRRIYDRDGYKTAKTVIQSLVDIVSKNGNLLLNIPVRGDGTIDEKERRIVEGIGAWMKRNGESIYGTRPWTVFGEGPAMDERPALNTQGFNEGKGKPFTAADIRFAVKGPVLYATMMDWPTDRSVLIRSLCSEASLWKKPVSSVTCVATGQSLGFRADSNGLLVTLPDTGIDREMPFVMKVS